MVRGLVVAGAGLMAAGAFRFALHTQAAIDDPLAFYLAQRCSDAAAALMPAGAGLMAGHCWGCPAMAAGALVMLSALALTTRRSAGPDRR